MGEKEDLITRAFIAALASYQKDHGQECTYDVDKLLKPTDTAAAAGMLLNQLSTGANTPAERQQSDMQTSSAADKKPLPLQNNARASASPKQHQHEQQSNTCDQQQQQQQQRRRHPSRNTASLSRRDQPNDPVSQQQQHQDEWAAAVAAAAAVDQNSVGDVEGMNNWQYGQWQNQEQLPWDQNCNAYGGWDGTAAAAGWGWQGCTYQQYMRPPPPPPPPPPPAPPLLPACFMHPGQQQPLGNSACCICGGSCSTRMQPAVAAASRDHAALLAALQQQVPADIAVVPESLQAARSAMEKAAAVLAMQDSVNNMPELLMAWFYAGYHAGRLSSIS